MRYITTLRIPQLEYDRINRLMELDNLSEMDQEELDAANAETEHWESVYTVWFADGAMVSYDLCSGMENYYDDVVWTSPSGIRRILLDCSYELADLEFMAQNGDSYLVKLIVE